MYIRNRQAGSGLLWNRHWQFIDQQQRLLENPDRTTPTGVRESVDALIRQRDLFIARRIDSTLRTNEFGVVFLGMLHSMIEQLPRDVQVVQLLPETITPLESVEACSPPV